MSYKEFDFGKEGKVVRVWPYGAIAFLQKDEEDCAVTPLMHLSRFELEDLKELAESALMARENWRNETGKH